MCFFIQQKVPIKEVEERFNAIVDNPDTFLKSEYINGFAHLNTPIIVDETPEIISTNFSWGLVPSWAKDEEIKKYTLNAKIETVHEKASFKSSVNKRCLIIANGYYEWKWLDPKGKLKNKYEIGLHNEALFAFAGLYSHWVNQTTGEIINSYSILTTEANPLLAEIHNSKKRMPVVIKQEDESRWLNHEPIAKFAFPYSANLIAKNLDTPSTLF